MYCFLRIKTIVFLLLLIIPGIAFASGGIIPTDTSQPNFLYAYKYVLDQSNVDMRFTNTTMDSALFPKFGEFSVYWAKTGANRGAFINPDVVPAYITNKSYDNYSWQNVEHYSIQFKNSTKNIALFKSDLKRNNTTVSWASLYFKNAFDSYLYSNMYYFISEKDLDSFAINPNTQLLIIPPFNAGGLDNKTIVDMIFTAHPSIKPRIDAFLAAGGTIYAEGNAVYFIEKLGYLAPNSVDFRNSLISDTSNHFNLTFSTGNHPLNFTELAVDSKVFTNSLPRVNIGNADLIAAERDSAVPVVFLLKGSQANGGKIICNTGMPTVGGMINIKNGSRQLQWMFNAVFSVWAKNIDYTRSIYNDIPDSVTQGKNAVSYDRADTFQVRIKLRNLTGQTITGVQVTEYIRDFFKFDDVLTPDMNLTINGSTLTFSDITLSPYQEMVIVYTLRTPDPTDPIHDKVNNYISWANYIYASYGIVTYKDDVTNQIVKYRNYVDLMFSADLAADTDLNWKNFLYLNYQPFKVFMIMENKERTPATETKYVQYIPKDVPFYWTDNSINIPILKTPGGKYVDVLRGSNDQNNPQYDQDGDGHPDVWLDTASIYPKNYTLTVDSVYWLNPWEHLRSGDTAYYEDINHDGIRARDVNGDGIVDVEAPGDKIRVWKVTWNIGKVSGYDYFDPYCSYEIWVDPPDLVPLSAGVGFVAGKSGQYPGMFYPYSMDINNPNKADTSWTHWMERDNNGMVIWKQLISQRINNYEGFTFIDTLNENYRLKPTDVCLGTVPQPHREFIAVLSLGGEEIDMNKFRPNKSLYSNLEYKTVFNEKRVTPIRSTYTYYAPLPNPLQFEYLSNNFTITNPANGDTMKFLPEWGMANLTFDMDASTEYSYYWIRNAGHKVDPARSPSLKIDGVQNGDGVFGYMVYDIPKGMGGYKITLPKKSDGTYDVDAIVKIDGKNYEKWLSNPNTKNNVEVLEDQFQYHVFIPQVLIPPALDDDNHDGIDDWIDDRGDRFHSSTGFLHDPFMLGSGEQYPNFPVVPFKDDIYGMVTTGWWFGNDTTYGDDFFENLGKTHVTIKAQYEGKGKEGPIDISKGGWLVVEEIFGGSPWVIFSHTLSGFASGVDLKITSQPIPSVVKFGLDTTFIKHTVQDANEPHFFNSDFDPYHVSYGYGQSTVTTYVGGSDPCSLIDPQINMPAIIDPAYQHKNITLVPYADATNPDLKGFPKKVSGTFVEVRIELSNGTDDNFINTTITPKLPPELQNSNIIMSYVVYPRPLVPAMADPVTGQVLRSGDQPGSFKAGWRFNQPEGEVLVKMGNTLNMLMPSRRAYFVYLLSVDESLQKGIYYLDFTMSGDRKYYDGTSNGKLNFEIPAANFSISSRDKSGTVAEYQKLVIGTGNLQNIKTQGINGLRGLENVRWSIKDINNTDFDKLIDKLPAKFDIKTGIETIDMSQFTNFPSPNFTKFNILEQAELMSTSSSDYIDITKGQELNTILNPFGDFQVKSNKVTVATIGPKIQNFKRVYSVNGNIIGEKDPIQLQSNGKKDVEVLVSIANAGNDIAEATKMIVVPGLYFTPILSKLPNNCTIDGKVITVNAGTLIPGQVKEMYIHYEPTPEACSCMFDTSNAVKNIDVSYKGKSKSGLVTKEVYTYSDKAILDFPAPDLNLINLTANTAELSIGSKITLTGVYQNGVKPLDNVNLEFFAIINAKDTVPINQTVVPKVDKFEKSQYQFDYTVPDSAYYMQFYAKIGVDTSIHEFCYNNNMKVLEIPFVGPNWIMDVSTNPNPFYYKADFSYVLPQAMNNIEIYIYTIDSKPIDKILDCPATLGWHSVTWNAPELAKGTYFYRISGIGTDGNPKGYIGKFIKDLY